LLHPALAKACAALGAQYRHTRPRTPQTNGLVERFNGRVGSEVLGENGRRFRQAMPGGMARRGITIYSHRQLEQLLRGFNAAYNARRQRVLEGQTPDQVVTERLNAKPTLAKGKPLGRAGPCDTTKARLIADRAKEVSQPDS
jgi:Integrase core domain